MRSPVPAAALAAALLSNPLVAQPAGPTGWQREEVHFENAGTPLAADLLIPTGRALPAVVVIQGSGASGRGNRWAYSIAERLAAGGVAVLIPDKRGTGASGGDWRTVGFGELAADARAAHALLAARPEVDARRVGYLGLSQGGHIAPLAAATTPGAGFAVNLAGSMQVMEQQLYDELESAYREHGLDDETIGWLQEFARFSFEFVRTGEGFERYLARRLEIAAGPLARAVESWPDSPDDPYWTLWRKIYDYDPIPWWRKLAAAGIPALVVYGAQDTNVAVPVSVARLRHALPGGGVELRVYEGTGHALRVAGTSRLRPDVFEETVAWIHATQRRAAVP